MVFELCHCSVSTVSLTPGVAGNDKRGMSLQHDHSLPSLLVSLRSHYPLQRKGARDDGLFKKMEEDLMLTFAVAVNGGLAVPAADAAINAFHRVLAQLEAVLQHIHHDLELAEDQHLHSSSSSKNKKYKYK